MGHIALRLVKICIFAALWFVSARILMKMIMKKKPDLRLYDPEILFPSVLAAAVITKLIMLAFTALTNGTS